MTQTMTKSKKKVVQTEIEVVDVPKLRFKITNTRTQAYPSPLTKTDYCGFKIGDLITQGYGATIIYEVVDIYRDVMTPPDYNRWFNRTIYTSKDSNGNIVTHIKDQLLHDLLQDYHKNNNFGVCKMKVKPVLRGSVTPANGKVKTFIEPDYVKCVNYNTLEIADLHKILKQKDILYNKIEAQAIKVLARRDSVTKQKEAVERIKNKFFPPEQEIIIEFPGKPDLVIPAASLL